MIKKSHNKRLAERRCECAFELWYIIFNLADIQLLSSSHIILLLIRTEEYQSEKPLKIIWWARTSMGWSFSWKTFSERLLLLTESAEVESKSPRNCFSSG